MCTKRILPGDKIKPIGVGCWCWRFTDTRLTPWLCHSPKRYNRAASDGKAFNSGLLDFIPPAGMEKAVPLKGVTLCSPSLDLSMFLLTGRQRCGTWFPNSQSPLSHTLPGLCGQQWSLCSFSSLPYPPGIPLNSSLNNSCPLSPSEGPAASLGPSLRHLKCWGEKQHCLF